MSKVLGSWSGMRRYLEQEMLAECLHGRIRYGWKLGGFNACETAGIEQVNMKEDHVRIRGFYPGSFPTGFLGYHAEQVDNDSETVPIFSSIERDRYYYAGGARFANIGSSGADSSCVTTLKLEGEGLVDMTYTTDPADYVQMELTPLAQWTE